MQKPNGLNQSRIVLKQDSTLIAVIEMSLSSWLVAGIVPGELVAAKRGRVLLVRRRRDRLWMFPGGRRRASETEKDCLRREIREELPELKLGRLRLWKEVKAKNRRSGRKMSDAIFSSRKKQPVASRLAIRRK
jgi:hypothetical protein